MISPFLKAYGFHIAVGIILAASTGGLYWYVRHQGVVAERGAQAQKELKSVVQAAKHRKEQIKEVSNARKEVDDAARAGHIPQRVQRFYVE